MCGFAITWNPEALDVSVLEHRGIKKTFHEIKKIYISDKGKAKYRNLELTHYKLPFQTELNDDWDQPIELSNGNYLLFTGEIFNIPSKYNNDVSYLKSFFESDDWLDKIGGPEYNKWDGFWSIVILTNVGIYSFTDPLGKKQLYHSADGLASEIKSLKCVGTDLKPNNRFNMYKPEKSNLTPFKGINRITPNVLHYHKFNNRGGIDPVEEIKQDLYSFKNSGYTEDPKELRKLIIKAVKDRIHNVLGFDDLNKEPQNTLFLSGGLDSTILLYCLKELDAMHLFEFITLENGTDEIYIKFLEEQLKFKVTRIKTTSWHLLSEKTKEKIIYQYESPIELGSLIPNYYLCKDAKTRCLISGDGADELFSGYKRAEISDTQDYDVLVELPYYHNIRLDRMSSMFTKELRSPFMSHEVIRWAFNCSYYLRRRKDILKKAFPEVPHQIQNRRKEPLRIKDMRFNKSEYQSDVIRKFKNTFNFKK